MASTNTVNDTRSAMLPMRSLSVTTVICIVLCCFSISIHIYNIIHTYENVVISCINIDKA